ncbi:MAG: hypothetical protein A2020_07965 [Lentisphaerae bacterium GWF2_45_14]|nr:MAG: hypothetical protein A2020_07965 [Lentisphaerae bacterium GWF2_45_14]
MNILYGDKNLKYPDTLQVESGSWIVQRPLVVSSHYDNELTQVLVPLNLETDYASVPLLFQNLFKKINEYSAVFLKHDVCYAGELFPRADCDEMLLEDLKAMGAGWIYRNTVYSAVRIGGRSVWRTHSPESKTKTRNLITQSKEILSAKGNRFGIWLDLSTGIYSNEWGMV